jgi:glycosyltransferase involved in cell wall biosynthesis
MNIVWDFRLFSYGYADRGVGVWVSAMADAIGNEITDERIIIWGEKNRVPRRFHAMAFRWIDYSPRSWKTDLLTIPFLIVKYHADLFHYWIGLGPIFRMGLGLAHPFCRTCLTVHDCGVEFWDAPASLVSARNTRYWKIQKILLANAGKIVCNSHATGWDIKRLFKGGTIAYDVLYPPLHYVGRDSAIRRENRFVTLSGDAHKNTDAVIQAFERFTVKHPGYSLAILGGCGNESSTIPGVVYGSMQRYPTYLENCAGFLACSFYEGLGLPALEAMMRDCPLVLSDIPAFRETCEGAAIFVDPHDSDSICRGMEECSSHGEVWTKRASQGAARYGSMSAGVGRKWLDMYHDLLENRRLCSSQ